MSLKQSSVFTFKDWQFDGASGELRMHYHDSVYGDFCETLKFPAVSPDRLVTINEPLTRAIHCLHWMAGVSYYKTSLAREIRFSHEQPDEQQARWLQHTWQAGLAELAYQHQLGWLDHIAFPAAEKTHHPEPVNLAPRSLVAIGGGKDSLVSIELLKAVNEDMQLFMVGQSGFIQQVAAATGIGLYQVERWLDPQLVKANESGAYNGHVPVTAINGCVAVVAALLGDFDAVVFSNERSADEGNVRADNGQWVNHQYSKSAEYEATWQAIIEQTVVPELHCFSLLRPFSELAIVRQFASFPQYFAVFSSCNRNFHLAGSKNLGHHWCGQCPKCAFVFLCLAPFVSRQALLQIFQQDLLANESLHDLWAALLDVSGIKPFECVGEARECRVAMQALLSHPDWRSHPGVVAWNQRIHPVPENWFAELMGGGSQQLIPAKRGFHEAIADVAE